MKAVLLGRQLSLVGSKLLKRTLANDAKKLTTLEVDDKSGFATLTLNRPPVNSLNLELLRDICNDIKQVEKNQCRGLVLTSSSNTVFSAGLDIFEMYQPEVGRMREFWGTLQEAWLTLYGSSVPTAAAINGHSPAGGCLLAASCEYRVMMPNFTIGLNETLLGLVAPSWFMAAYVNVLPRRVAEMALTQGKMFTTDEALKVGLVDETAESKEEAIQKCHTFLRKFAKVNPTARGLTKQQFRQKDLQELMRNREKDLETFVGIAMQDKVQKALGMYIESQMKKAKK